MRLARFFLSVRAQVRPGHRRCYRFARAAGVGPGATRLPVRMRDKLDQVLVEARREIPRVTRKRPVELLVGGRRARRF